ncbi:MULTISPECIES: HlyD family secretion protein [Legionella]|uniref:HlyD family secretion protein n=1 Tax=Legionella TaxID=445 RepID=UPI000968FCDE|nr:MULTISPECIES: HlyD family efflux transporter periplasmic adaptor subunit [Legionella]MBN9226325.1 HlyD family efflux transporter periplasmic adaptor subunit [Legionella steelei]OJW12066.1 MAG: glycoside hydrolase family 43 [Legionella sp. 39-23]
MIQGKKSKLLLGITVIILGIFLFSVWKYFQPRELGSDFASGNGRIEAIEVDIDTKVAGRIKKILVDEGDFVKAGQVLAIMDADSLEAQLREAKAKYKEAQSNVISAKYQVIQRKNEKEVALATVAQRQAELNLAKNRLFRVEKLVAKGAASVDSLDEAKALFYSAEAVFKAANAQVAEKDAMIATAEAQVSGAELSVDAADATVERLKVDIKDSTLVAPLDGRIQFRVAQPGEVLAAGGKVLNMVDLTNVYMVFFLPTEQAGRVQIGAPVHLVLDAIPQYVIPAKVTFVADVAQFTPKTVETASERQKLMFRIKARISPKLLKKYIYAVKTGLPGMAYVQLNPKSKWPANIQVTVPND